MPSPLCRTILRQARDGDGAAYLSAMRTTVMGAVVDNGRVMISASAGGQAYAFIEGIKITQVVEALDEAESIYAAYDSVQIANLLDRPMIRSTVATFR